MVAHQTKNPPNKTTKTKLPTPHKTTTINANNKKQTPHNSIHNTPLPQPTKHHTKNQTNPQQTKQTISKKYFVRVFVGTDCFLLVYGFQRLYDVGGDFFDNNRTISVQEGF